MTARQSLSVTQATLVFLSSMLIGAVLASASVAYGHSASSIFPLKWTADETYYVGNSGGIGQSNLWSASEAALAQWNGTAASREIYWGAYQSTGPFSGCSVPTNDVYVYGGIHDGVGNDLGVTVRCGGSSITRASILFDAVESWYSGSGTPGGAQFDLRSVAAHEWGHAFGFAGHWQDHDALIDCTSSARETMCSSLPKGTSYMRSLQTHDMHSLVSAYP